MLITFIGGGNMATALINGLDQSGDRGLKIRVSDPSEEVRIRMQSTYEIEVFSESGQAIENADVVVLAVKPQIIPLVLRQVSTVLEPEQLVLSIAAGTTIESMAARLQTGQAIIRSMPNTPALVGEGISAMCAGKHCRQHHRDQAEKILSAAGEVIWLESETLMDAVTAISGSGPAYFFLLAEALTEAGIKLGLPESISRRLAEQTCTGAGVMLKKSEFDAAELRRRVTSPGGTTQAALDQFHKEHFTDMVQRATSAAESRSQGIVTDGRCDVNGTGINAVSYLVGTLIDLYVGAVLLRLLLQWVRADFYNPLSQFLIKVTNPVLVPLRRFIPSIGRLDTASVVLMLILEFVGIWLVATIASRTMMWQQIITFGVIKLIMTLLMTYFFLIIISVILSWLGQGLKHPFIPLIYQLTEPVLRPFRKVIPPIAGIDLSPMFALIALRFLMLLLGW